MEHLTISHIQHYLAYGLRVQCNNKIWELTELNTDTDFCKIKKNGCLVYSESIHSITPLLLPLSALYEEIDGEVGIVELAKIAFPKREFKLRRSGCWCDAEKFMYDKATNSFRTLHEEGGCFSQGHEITNQLNLFEYLFSHHYDVYDLCSKGLAIDKRSVK